MLFLSLEITQPFGVQDLVLWDETSAIIPTKGGSCFSKQEKNLKFFNSFYFLLGIEFYAHHSTELRDFVQCKSRPLCGFLGKEDG